MQDTLSSLRSQHFTVSRSAIQQHRTPPRRNPRPLYRNADRSSALLREAFCVDETFVSASTERPATSPQAELPSSSSSNPSSVVLHSSSSAQAKVDLQEGLAGVAPIRCNANHRVAATLNHETWLSQTNLSLYRHLTRATTIPRDSITISNSLVVQTAERSVAHAGRPPSLHVCCATPHEKCTSSLFRHPQKIRCKHPSCTSLIFQESGNSSHCSMKEYPKRLTQRFGDMPRLIRHLQSRTLASQHIDSKAWKRYP